MPLFNKVFVDGTIGTGGIEKFSCGFTYTGPSGEAVQTPGDLNAWALAIYTDFAVGTNYQTLKGLLSGNAAVTRIRTYLYDTAGPAQAAGAYTGGGVVGAGTQTRPPQCSGVFTLSTGLAGRSFRGRVYWPWLTGSMTAAQKATGQGSPNVDMAAWLSFMGDNAPIAADLVPVVHSPTKGLLTPISSVRFGDVVDTQRRRRDNLVEIYQSSAVG